ncbi:APC family permease [Leuconostoc pseudomesenteroides]|jgi:amino acid transporter|uniref:APC family permease n=1 Tax=Leuconostoc TaxID=1243 RepID=UPI0011DDF98B|nr:MULTISPECIES: APC family permease [Leuconostoc]MBK0040850.1 APC family permease [Leuconostoc sp. S51]MBK0051399.1 APC family permease [Leuconostoc sp. S50]MBS0958487.1 APC family permease [Leuconostoc pseudomesenteroides]MCT4380870.1 APC family permease [Leuconostoc pseudomesenteroides]MCT4413815.1 APC family permease [Leuconostoc pseudomesenteroides]
MFQNIKRILIGKPLKTLDEGGQSLSKTKALALLSSDALSSVAYGTESITTALLAAGAVALWLQVPIALLVLVLLAAIVMSYRQIIHAYPSGGGAYAVASENWGSKAGLVAGGSLLVDYMLTVAVSASAAADAITAAVPAILPFTVPLSIIVVLLLTGMNLRGLRESANFLMIPVYFFITVLAIMIAWGVFQAVTGQLPYHAAAKIGTSFSGLSFVLFMRAFSSGSSSLTGVEAISNAVPNFKVPKEKHAASTLALMALILAAFFGGITFLSYWYGIHPNAHSTVLSQIAMTTFGGQNIGFYIVQLATAMILAVAANTGFSAFPMLALNLARDKYLPHLYMDKGDRLGYSNGILSLSFGAIILLLIFHGSTDALIPLYAVGVFVPFTLSQSGMIIHWWHKKPKNWVLKAVINFVGAFISAVLVITLFATRIEHVWPYLLIMPVVMFTFLKIKHHYLSIGKQLRLQYANNDNAVRHHYDGATVIVLVSNITKVTTEAIDYAQSIGDYVVAMHVSFDVNPKKELETSTQFKLDFPDVRYVDIHSSYRSIVKPALSFVDAVAKQAKKRNHSVTVLVPQFVPKKPWQNILHNQNSLRLRTAFASREDISVSTYYYHLTE